MNKETEENIVRQHAFDFELNAHRPMEDSQSQSFLKMHGWQAEAFDELKDSPLMILNAPTGSGKTFLMCLMSAYKMRRNKDLRCIIGVPQTIISSGFADAKMKMTDGEEIHWVPKHHLCNGEIDHGTVKYLIEWLDKGSYESLNDRVLLCSHQTLIRVYKKLKIEKRLDLLKQLLLWVDEAHHISIEDVGFANRIGELVAFLFENRALSIQIGLTTATLFRGDRQTLLSPSMAACFEKGLVA